MRTARPELMALALVVLFCSTKASDTGSHEADLEFCQRHLKAARDTLLLKLSEIVIENSSPRTVVEDAKSHLTRGLVAKLSEATASCRGTGREAATLAGNVIYDALVQYTNAVSMRQPGWGRVFRAHDILQDALNEFLLFSKAAGVSDDDLKKADGPLWTLLARFPWVTPMATIPNDELLPYRMEPGECRRFYAQYKAQSVKWSFHPVAGNNKLSVILLRRYFKKRSSRDLSAMGFCDLGKIEGSSIDEWIDIYAGVMELGTLKSIASMAGKLLSKPVSNELVLVRLLEKAAVRFEDGLPTVINPSTDQEVAEALGLLVELARRGDQLRTGAIDKGEPVDGRLFELLFKGVISYVESLESVTPGAKSFSQDLTKFLKLNFGKKKDSLLDAKIFAQLHMKETVDAFVQISRMFLAVSQGDLFTQNQPARHAAALKEALVDLTGTVPGLTFHKSLSLQSKLSRSVLGAYHLFTVSTTSLASLAGGDALVPLLRAVKSSLAGKKASEKLVRFALLMMYTFKDEYLNSDTLAEASRVATEFTSSTDKSIHRNMIKTLASLASVNAESPCGTASNRVAGFNMLYLAVKSYVNARIAPGGDKLNDIEILDSIAKKARFACASVSFEDAEFPYPRIVQILSAAFEVDALQGPWLLEGMYRAMFPERDVTFDRFQAAMASESNPMRGQEETMAFHVMQLTDPNNAEALGQGPDVKTGDSDSEPIEDYTYAKVGRIEAGLFRDIIGLGPESFREFRSSSPANIKILEPFPEHIRSVWLENDETIDDPAWLFNMGEWTGGSCQTITAGDLFYNIGVVGTMASANMRLLAASSTDILGERGANKTPIGGRSVIRLVKHDGFDAVLLIDRVYYGKWLPSSAEARQEVIDVMAAKAGRLVERLSDGGRYRVAVVNTADESEWRTGYDKLERPSFVAATSEEASSFEDEPTMMTGSVGPTYIDANGGIFEGECVIDASTLEESLIQVSTPALATGEPADASGSLESEANNANDFADWSKDGEKNKEDGYLTAIKTPSESSVGSENDPAEYVKIMEKYDKKENENENEKEKDGGNSIRGFASNSIDKFEKDGNMDKNNEYAAVGLEAGPADTRSELRGTNAIASSKSQDKGQYDDIKHGGM